MKREKSDFENTLLELQHLLDSIYFGCSNPAFDKI